MDEQKIKKHFGKQNGFGDLKEIAIKLLKETIDILDEFNIDYFIISGTLLGYIRHNDIIPWDDDIDLIVDKKIFDVLPEIIKKYNDKIIFTERKGWIIKTCFNAGCNGSINIRNSNVFKEYNIKYCFPYIDLFIFSYTGNTEITFFNKNWNISDFFPSEKKIFLGIFVSVPKNPEYFLKKNYGDNYMNVVKSKNWNHRMEIPIRESMTVSMEEYIKYKSILC